MKNTLNENEIKNAVCYYLFHRIGIVIEIKDVNLYSENGDFIMAEFETTLTEFTAKKTGGQK